MIAAAYLRKSNDEGDKAADIKSVAVQREQIERLIAAHGWTLDERYVFADDDVSGGIALDERLGGARLFAALATRPAPFQVLVVNEQSRLGRGGVDTLTAIRDIERAGVAIWSCNNGRQITLDDEGSELLAMFESWKDKSERKRTSKRVRDAAFRRHATGRVAGGTVYGYRNVREHGGVRREVVDDQTPIIRRIFEMTRNGFGLLKIAKRLNAEGVPAPRAKWSPTGIREILRRETYRGVEVFGRMQRTGPKTRARVAKDDWQRREAPELRVIDDTLWEAAHAQIAQAAAVFLRRRGRLAGQVESLRGKYLLSGFVACGVCNAPLQAMKRGRNLRPGYVCKSHRENGVCTNTTAVPMDRLHAAVIASLRDTLSPENFERHLAVTAADESARASRGAERATLLARIPVLTAECERLADAVAGGSGTLDVLLSGIKTRQAEREAAEARVVELESIERDLRADADAVERLRTTWKDWGGALDADPVLARQVLRKVLVGSILVFPRGRGQWSFGGFSRFDGLLTGRIAPAQTLVAKWDGRERIDALVRSRYPDAVGGPSPLPWPGAVVIAGGSDAPAAEAVCNTVRDGEMAPIPPPLGDVPAEP